MAFVLEMENLSVGYPGGVQAVRGVSISLRKGTIHALVGESGCGKSVTTKALVGLLPATASVQWDRLGISDRHYVSGDDRLRELRGTHVGMIFQEPAKHLNPAMTIGRMITEVLRYHLGMTRQDSVRRACELLAMVELDASRVFRSYPHELSGGMKQRALIAMAVSC
ncbi:MAG: ABC transporter ATP-binding protein, partial [Spirochaetales bacterium]